MDVIKYMYTTAYHDLNASNATKNRLIDWLFTLLRPAQEFFTYMEK
jgi:hypothetical protein